MLHSTDMSRIVKHLTPDVLRTSLKSIGEMEALLRVAGRCRGAEEGRGRVPLGLCTGPVDRPCSRLEHTPAQAAHPCGRQQGRGLLGYRDCLGLNTLRSGVALALTPAE